jgi:anthranilate synthase component 1
VSTPDLADFGALAADRRVIPVVRRLHCDALTPVGLYFALTGGRPRSFLLESAEPGGVFARYSIVGRDAPSVLTVADGQARWEGPVPAGVPTSGDPLEVLAATCSYLHTPRFADLPPLTGGLVGYLGYDAVRRLERLPERAVDDLGLPEMAFLLATDLAVYDHVDGTVTLIANAVNWDGGSGGVAEAWQSAVARLDEMEAALAAPVPTLAARAEPSRHPEPRRRRTEAEYGEAVQAAREAIFAGEAFQVVVSQRFEADCPADALEVYRVLRATNPSPYLYLVRFDDLDVVGSSPEALVKVADGRVMTHPIAGTRPRGQTPEDDAALADDLLADAKERAEHLMLVDLGRNDLGRVCAPGSVEVVDFMSVRRYSHVMHIESTVVGRLADDRTALDALLACFPAGTLSGAPKVRAMELIEELEPTRRGLYGGVVGYLDFAGDLDTAIAIRTAVIRDGVALVQAGAGIVADSDPATEDLESRNKAAAVLRAVAAAGDLRRIG